MRLVFRFESWGSLLGEVQDFNRAGLERPEFKDDPEFKENTIAVQPVATVSSIGLIRETATPICLTEAKYADEKAQPAVRFWPTSTPQRALASSTTTYLRK